MTVTLPPTDDQLAESSHLRYRWLEIALILAVFFVEGGAPAPHVNEPHYLTKAKHYWDPTFCPGDFFLDSADAHLAFYWSIGWVAQWLTLAQSAWLGRVVVWTLIAIAWQKLVRSVTAAPLAALISAALWVTFTNRCNFAGEWAIGGVEAKCFAWAGVLMGWAAIARNNWRSPWLWFGAASALHPVVGGWAVITAIILYVTEPGVTRPPVASLVGPLFVGGLLSLPGLLPTLLLSRGADQEAQREAARVYVFDRLPHHLAPLSLQPDEFYWRYAIFGMMSIGLAIVWLWILRDRREVGDSRLQFDATRRLIRLALISILVNHLGLALEAMLSSRPVVAASVLRFYWFRHGDIAVPMALSIAAIGMLSGYRPSKSDLASAATPTEASSSGNRFHLAALLAAVSVAAAVVHLGVLSVARFQQPWPPATAKLDDYRSWRAACEWVRDNTPSDALCVIPRHGYSFKWFAHRADIGNWKDIPQDATGVVEWRRRMDDIFTVKGIDGEVHTLSWPNQWGTQRAREVARRYKARYIVARAYPPLALRRVYPGAAPADDQWYVVYDAAPPSEELP